MRWRLTDAGRPKRMAMLVSREDHCLVDLLWRHRRGELDADIPLVASNHPDHRADVEGFGIPYHHVPVPATSRSCSSCCAASTWSCSPATCGSSRGEFLDRARRRR